MKRNLSQIKPYLKKKKNTYMKKSSLSQSSLSLDISLIPNKSSSINSSIIINSEEIPFFNLESLIVLENAIYYFFNPKINQEINSFLDYFKTIRYFMFNISLKKIFQTKESNNSKNLEIIENFLNLQFLSILLEGILITKRKNNIRLKNIIKNCISSTYQNFLLLCHVIIYELNRYCYTNIYINKLTQIILTKSIIRINHNSKEIFNKINKKNKEILTNLKNILNTNKSMINLNKYISPLSLVLKSFDKINTNWTIDYCLKVLGLNDSIIKKINNATYLNVENISYPLYLPIKIPFLDKISEKSYILTVILDLDETLIRYNINDDKFDPKNLIKRPYLYEFLSCLINKGCELVIFTASSKEYADPIINEIEKDNKYFSKRLYRQHTVLIEDNYVKDLTKLGRDLNKIIIVDNEQNSFSLQKRNGILIKPFLGEEKGFNLDMALDNLSIILMKIINNSFQDIRKELELYKEEIENKVTKDI